MTDATRSRTMRPSAGIGALAEKMGIEFLELSAERAVARMPVEGNTQPAGCCTAAPTSCSASRSDRWPRTCTPAPGKLAVGIEINATHTRSATSGWVTGTCTPIHLGRTLTTHEIAMTDEQGRRCSTIRITNMIKDL